MPRLRLSRDLPALALLLAAGAMPLAARAENQPLIQLDLPASSDLTEIIGRDLAAEAGKTEPAPIPTPAQSATSALAPDGKKPESNSTETPSAAPPLAAPPAASALALIERAPEAVDPPVIALDIPLPEPFVSFEGIETGKPETKSADADPAPKAAEAPTNEQPKAARETRSEETKTEETKAAEAPVQLDIPAPPVITAVIDVPKAEAKPAEPETKPASGLALALDESKIRALLEPYRARLRLRPVTIESFVAAYQARENRALWLTAEGKPLPDIASLVSTFREAAADGLDPERLLALLPNLKPGEALAPERQAEADLAFSLAAFTFASDARGGRLDPRSLSAMLTPKLTLPSPQEVLAAIEARGESPVSAVLSAYLPQHKGYQALRAELAKARAEAMHTASTGGGSEYTNTIARFMGDAPLGVGQSDPRVPLLRARLRLPAADDLVYSGALVDAVKEFQRANDLTPNGRITPRTRALLDDPKTPVLRTEKRPDHERRIADLIANMERWRWLPPELGATHVFVNIPEFRMEMRSEGERVFESRVIVGKIDSQTPIFSDEMQFLVVNPSWTIPPTILKRDYLPKLAADPEYASRKGFEVIRRGNNISIRQPPGEKNALGHIKFMFPNNHAVYLHDTPGRHLFASGTRAFSAGCVRVEGPFRLAEAMLRRQGFDEKSLRGMVGRGERTIKLQERFPVHLAYFTLFVDQSGALQSKPDLYGHDARLRRALQL